MTTRRHDDPKLYDPGTTTTVIRGHGAFRARAHNDNVPVGRRVASDVGVGVSVAALIAGIAVFHSLAVFL